MVKKKLTKNQRYWANRLIKQRERLLDKSIEECYAELQRVYEETARKLTQKLTSLYDEMEMLGKDNVLHSHKYSYQKYYQQLAEIKEELRKLGIAENEILNKDFTKYYEANHTLLGKQLGIANHFDEEKAKQVISQIWATDGKSFSDRIWKDKAELISKLDAELTRIVSTGTGKNELIKGLAQSQLSKLVGNKNLIKKQLNQILSISFYNARRITTTELSRLYNTSTMEKYKEAGIKEYQILAERDSRTCEECLKLDGKKFPITDLFDRPPFHPNCRCTILGVINNAVYEQREEK